MANRLDTILIVGKDGVTPNVVAQAADALKARELIKGRVLENSLLSPREACDLLAERCRAESVQCIGSKFVLYKRNEAAPKIVLNRFGAFPAEPAQEREKAAKKPASAPRRVADRRASERADRSRRGGAVRTAAGGFRAGWDAPRASGDRGKRSGK